MKTLRERLSAMRLSTRLKLAFAAVAALPLLTVPLVLRAVNESYDRSFARELDEAARLVRAELDREGAEVLGRTRAAATGALSRAVAQGLDEGDPSGLVASAPAWLSDSGLDVLEMIDHEGRILFSGHLPARLGDDDPTALSLLRQHEGETLLANVEVRRGDELGQALALVTVVPARQPDGAAVLGGRLFDVADLTRLSNLVRGEVTLKGLAAADAKVPARAGWKSVFGRVRAVRELPFASADGDRPLRIRLSDEALVETKSRIAQGALGAFALAMLLGAALATVLVRNTVSPMEALVEGTKELAKGDLSHRVDVDAPAEIGELVVAFNEMAADLSRARDRLAQAERVAAWEQIARALAHEIKNPLTPIAMAIETIQRTWDRKHPEFDKYFREGTATVLEEVGRLKRLASEFGEFARWPKPMMSPATPAELVRTASSLYSSPPTGLVVDSACEPDLPPVNVDRDQMQRALVNLVKNAMEAMPAGGHVLIRARTHAGGVAIEVVDNGPGFALETRKRLFEPYYTTKAEGTGLGLAIVHRIATEHQGRIEVDETPGGGATFRLWFPALAASTVVAPAA